MTKAEKSIHDQRVINSLNSRLDDLDELISRGTTYEVSKMITNQRKAILKRLIKLYGTEKYSMVT